MFYSTCEVLCNQIPTKKQKLYNSSQKFQDASTTHLSWAKSIVDENGLMQQVRCKICTFIERKEKLLAPKLDSLLKHVGAWKAKVSMLGVDYGSHYFNKNLMHAKNRHEFFIVKHLSMLDQLQIDVPLRHKWKYV
jgi:hypothetical protein